MLYKMALMFAVVILLSGLSCGGGDDGPPPTTQPTQPTVQPTEPPDSRGGDVVKVENQDIGGSGEYIFVPSEFNFKVGQTVTFEMSAETEFHTFTVDELDIDEEVNAGEIVTFTYTFDSPGRFELICIPHLAFGMTGVIVVE